MLTAKLATSILEDRDRHFIDPKGNCRCNLVFHGFQLDFSITKKQKAGYV